jgi:hypothetical protein
MQTLETTVLRLSLLLFPQQVEGVEVVVAHPKTQEDREVRVVALVLETVQFV